MTTATDAVALMLCSEFTERGGLDRRRQTGSLASKPTSGDGCRCRDATSSTNFGLEAIKTISRLKAGTWGERVQEGMRHWGEGATGHLESGGDLHLNLNSYQLLNLHRGTVALIITLLSLRNGLWTKVTPLPYSFPHLTYTMV